MQAQDPDEYGDEFEDDEPEVDDDATADYSAGEPESEEDELEEEEDTPEPETNRRRRAPLRVRLSRRSSAQRAPAGGDAESMSEDDEPASANAPQPMTARQIARANRARGVPVDELADEPSSDPPQVDTDLALRRSELARRRRNQSEKKLEDDKVETINRLLKKQAGRVRGKARPEGDEAAPKARPRPADGPLPYFRYVSRVSGSLLAVPPSGAEEEEGPYEQALRCAFGKSRNEWH